MKLLKIKVGELFEDGKSKPVFLTAFPRKSKKGEAYFEASLPIFVNEVQQKPKPIENEIPL